MASGGDAAAAAAAPGGDVPEAPAAAPKLEAAKSELADSKLSVDVLIVMDCTGSMGSYIAAAKSSALKTARDIHDEAPNTRFRLGFVGYRDLCDSPAERYIVIPLTEDVAAVERALGPVGASGGGDTPEDVVGGLRKALEADWRGDTRIVLMVADAPCHGREFHSCDDSYPGGDPSGTDPRDLVKELARRGMDFYFMRCANIVDTMVAKFSEAFEAAKAGEAQIFSVLDLASQGGGDGGFGGGMYRDEAEYARCADIEEEGDLPAARGIEVEECDDDCVPVLERHLSGPVAPGAPPVPMEAPVAAAAAAAPPPPMAPRRLMAAPAAAMRDAAPRARGGGGGGGGVTDTYASAVTESIKRSMRSRVAASAAT